MDHELADTADSSLPAAKAAAVAASPPSTTACALAAAVGWQQLREQDPDLDLLCLTWLSDALQLNVKCDASVDDLVSSDIAELGLLFWEACGRSLAHRLFGDASIWRELDAACDWGLPGLGCDLQAALSLSSRGTADAAADLAAADGSRGGCGVCCCSGCAGHQSSVAMELC